MNKIKLKKEVIDLLDTNKGRLFIMNSTALVSDNNKGVSEQTARNWISENEINGKLTTTSMIDAIKRNFDLDFDITEIIK